MQKIIRLGTFLWPLTVLCFGGCATELGSISHLDYLETEVLRGPELRGANSPLENGEHLWRLRGGFLLSKDATFHDRVQNDNTSSTSGDCSDVQETPPSFWLRRKRWTLRFGFDQFLYEAFG